MICLPKKDPNQFDLFDSNINFAAEPSTSSPPNIQDIMDELIKSDAFADSPNLAVIDQIETQLVAGRAFWDAEPASEQRTTALELFDELYDFSADSNFDQFTQLNHFDNSTGQFTQYVGQFNTTTNQFVQFAGEPGQTGLVGQPTQFNSTISPLMNSANLTLFPSGLGGIQQVLDVARSHLLGVPTSIPGALGSLGQANILRSLNFANSGNTLQRSLGLGAIPDCGLIDQLFGMLLNLLQPFIDLLAALLSPLFDLLASLLGILGAILNELFGFLSLIQQLLNFLNASQFLSLDPCSLLFMGQNGSAGLNNAVNEGIVWNNPDAPTIPTPGPDLRTPF